jgi:hypothetical protein
MLRTLLVSLVLLIGCNKNSESTTTPAGSGPGNGTGTGAGIGAALGSGSSSEMCGMPNQGAITEEQCTCLGGRVNASAGGGAQAHCAAGETEVAAVRFGIEGGWCCKKP